MAKKPKDGVVETQEPAAPESENPQVELSPADQLEQLKQRNDELEKKNRHLSSLVEEQGLTGEVAELANIKIKGGLSREDALQSARRQIIHDKAIKENEAHRSKQRASGLKENQIQDMPGLHERLVEAGQSA